MIYKYTKCESVIAKILADSDQSEKNIRVTDIREWIFEAVEKIGAPTQYVKRESGVDCVPIFQIHEGQIPIPEDLESLVSVAYSQDGKTNWIPAKKDESTFNDINFINNNVQHNSHDDIKFEKMPTHRSQLLGINHSTKVLDYIFNSKEQPSYWVKPGWIVFNRDKGFVKLAYKAIATDERGYPLIPDLASYQEAIYWYVMMKLSFPKFLKGNLGGKVTYNQNTYFYIQQQWNFYRNQAYAEAMMPNENEMSDIKNEWTKLIPDWSSDDNFFKNLGTKQLNFNDYYYGY